MTELELRQKFVDTAISYLGCNEKDGSHRKIIDLYNAHKPLARGYKVKYNDAWCATFVSAMAIQCGLTAIIPTECSCHQMITLHKKLGTWVESDAHVPKPGDLILYDWDDNGRGDNVGLPDHIGVVIRVNGDDILVIEGNIVDKVGYRKMAVNGKLIRGYCVPDFASLATKEVDTVTVELPVLKKGAKRDEVKSLQAILIGFGYSCGSSGVDGSFGAATDKAVRAYQKAHGLAVDGSVGPATWTSLLNA
jgi:hypothetical protein